MTLAVHWMQALVAGAAAMVVGWLWYSVLFVKPWMETAGVTQAQIEKAKKKGMGKNYGISFLLCWLLALAFDLVLSRMNVRTFSGLLRLVILLWFGFQVPLLYSPVLWQGKSPKLFLINAGYYLTALAVIGAVLYAMRISPRGGI